MNDNFTDISIVLDRSGSMSSVATDTIGGFNKFIEDQRKVPGQCRVSLIQFDNEYETVYDAKDVKDAPLLDTATFVPRGNTALLDAIGRTVIATGARLSAMPEADRPGKILFVIITDGHENASHEYNKSAVFEMIKHQREAYNWQFVFIGANQDAIATASGIGIPQNAALTNAQTPIGVAAMYSGLSANTSKLRCSSGKAQYSWNDSDRAAQVN